MSLLRALAQTFAAPKLSRERAAAMEQLITPQDEAVLAQQDMPTLAEWWGVLNVWGWPEPLENPEPSVHIPNSRRGQLMRWIEEAVGLRACYRYSKPWKDESEEHFNDFWRGCFEGHLPSWERYRKWSEMRVQAKECQGK